MYTKPFKKIGVRRYGGEPIHAPVLVGEDIGTIFFADRHEDLRHALPACVPQPLGLIGTHERARLRHTHLLGEAFIHEPLELAHLGNITAELLVMCTLHVIWYSLVLVVLTDYM